MHKWTSLTFKRYVKARRKKMEKGVGNKKKPPQASFAQPQLLKRPYKKQKIISTKIHLLISFISYQQRFIFSFVECLMLVLNVTNKLNWWIFHQLWKKAIIKHKMWKTTFQLYAPHGNNTLRKHDAPWHKLH
jgi:hypothetical protein